MAERFPNMLESFECEGFWRTREQPDDELPGILSFDPHKGLRLKVSGKFRRQVPSSKFTLLPSRTIEPSIQGFTQDGKHITLLNCSSPGSRMNIPGYEVTSYYVELMLMSDREQSYSSLGDVEFQVVDVNFLHLEEWLGVSPIEHSYGEIKTEQGKEEVVETKFTHKLGRIIPLVDLTDSILSYHFSVHVDPIGLRSIREVHWKQNTFLEIKPFSNPKSWDWFLDKINGLQSFLAIFASEAIHPKIIKAYGEILTPEDVSIPNPVTHIYYANPYQRLITDISPLSILVSARNFGKEALQTVVKAWFDNVDYIKPLSELFLGLLYNRQFSQFTLLALTQALEGYHRKRFSGYYLSDEEYEPFKAQLIAAIPPALPDPMKQSMINGAIKYSNQYSLVKRLKELLRLFDKELQQLMRLDTDFLVKVVSTRNQYTHREPSASDSIFVGKELERANTRLGAFVMMLIFRELGVSTQLMKQALERLFETGRLD
jgi:hypothetical protein